jgi:omega-amidase
MKGNTLMRTYTREYFVMGTRGVATVNSARKYTISLAQMEVTPSSPDENLHKGKDLIAEAARRGSDLICFPEMWTSGFPWEDLEGIARVHPKVLKTLCNHARTYRIWINGSMPMINLRGRVANTSVLIDPQGNVAGRYEKIHLFTFFHEEKFIDAGSSLCLVDAPFGRTGLSICYDIRFPELFRTYALKGAELILSPMAFPYPRLEHWKILARARAIENQVYIVAVNRVGNEEMGDDQKVTYFGDSVIIGPWGETVIEGSERDEQLLTATIDLTRVGEVRSSMRILQDRRPDMYELG